MPLPPAYHAIIVDQQTQLAKLVRSIGVAPVRRMYDDMLADIEKRMGRVAVGSFTHHQLQILMAQARLGIARLQHNAAGAVQAGADEIGIHAARTILTNAAKLEQHFTGAAISIPLLESGRLRGMVEGKTSSLMRVHASSMARYGQRLTGRIEATLASSLTMGEDQSTAIDRVMRVGELEWYGAERIVRTEMSFAANVNARAAADEQADELDGDMWSRWTEHVSDDGAPFDDRVGVDSEAMHGQVAAPGEMFTQPGYSPEGELVGDSLVGRQWSCPPNRPNDRAVLVPWRSSWGIPGWRWEGRRVPVTQAAAERTNAAWMRARGRAPADEDAPAEPTFADRLGVFGPKPTVTEDARQVPRGVVQVPSAIEDEAADVEADEPGQTAGIGFASPVVLPSHDDVAAELEQRRSVWTQPKVVPAAAVADVGWYEPPAEVDERAVADAIEHVSSGKPPAVGMGVAPSGRLVVSEGRENLTAAVHLGGDVSARWTTADEPGPDHEQRFGMRIGVGHAVRGGGDDVAPTREIPHGRASIGALAAAELLARDRLAVEVVADAAVQPRGTTSIWQPGDENRNRQVVSLATRPRTQEEWYQDDLRRQRERQESARRLHEESDRRRTPRPPAPPDAATFPSARAVRSPPPPTPAGYDPIVVDGRRYYRERATGRTLTEQDVRDAAAEPAESRPGLLRRFGAWIGKIVRPGR